MRSMIRMMLCLCLCLCLCLPWAVAGPVAGDKVLLETPPSPGRAVGELTDIEERFQGAWRLSSRDSGSSTGTLQIDGREFRAETVHGSYVGYVTIRSDTSPGRIDFTIEACGCKFEGMTSPGIFMEEGGGIVFASPAPGERRPASFDDLDPANILIERATRAEL